MYRKDLININAFRCKKVWGFFHKCCRWLLKKYILKKLYVRKMIAWREDGTTNWRTETENFWTEKSNGRKSNWDKWTKKNYMELEELERDGKRGRSTRSTSARSTSVLLFSSTPHSMWCGKARALEILWTWSWLLFDSCDSLLQSISAWTRVAFQVSCEMEVGLEPLLLSNVIRNNNVLRIGKNIGRALKNSFDNLIRKLCNDNFLCRNQFGRMLY